MTLRVAAAVPPFSCISGTTGPTLDPGTGEALLLYFVYTARLAPGDLIEVAPSATFEFVAHLPESGLAFAIEGNGWKGGLPTVIPEPGSTVWGAVFSVPSREMKLIDDLERAEHRDRVDADAIDRTGRRHRVALHRATDDLGPELAPSRDYLGRMLVGSRHWDLPVGWIVSLDDRLDEPAGPAGRKWAFRP